jgi:hypothetical protein
MKDSVVSDGILATREYVWAHVKISIAASTIMYQEQFTKYRLKNSIFLALTFEKKSLCLRSHYAFLPRFQRWNWVDIFVCATTNTKNRVFESTWYLRNIVKTKSHIHINNGENRNNILREDYNNLLVANHIIIPTFKTLLILF